MSARTSKITAKDKLACVERELMLRYRRYPALVEAGKLTQRTADREIALMEEIAADCRTAAEIEAASK